MTSKKTINLFYSYSHEDEALREKLEKHLKLLQRQNVIDSWHDRKIMSGTEWDKVINNNLDTADIILLLISADFFASDYCWDIEIQRAMQRHEEKSAVVIPVFLRPCDTGYADFMKLQGLPKNFKPVTTWTSQDQAFTDIAKGIRAAAEAIRNDRLVPQAKVPSAKPMSTKINSTDAKTPASGKETVVEVAHEAVLTHWELLKNWINQRFGDFCLLRQARMEAAEWERYGRAEANLWPHERLQKVFDMQLKLKPQLSESVCAFIRPEAERFVEKLNNPALTHQQRELIGVRLAEIGDPRPGLGIDEIGLPQFEWCSVPPGRIELVNNAGTFDVEACFISQFPVTFKQYRAFLEAADGYHNPHWWTDLQYEPESGKQYRRIDNHPAETVSWFDAMAFCRWLSDKRGFEIRLPAEWEWQQAATGGNPENVCPWGTGFESLRCNTNESGLGRTTAAGLYPQGISPGGALDMSGNVWEWCSNRYDKPESVDVSGDVYRVVRGGSWSYSQVFARAACRDRSTPGARDYSLGFRVVCSSPII